MKILISGASGLVGKALLRALQAQGHSVARLVRPGGADPQQMLPGIRTPQRSTSLAWKASTQWCT